MLFFTAVILLNVLSYYEPLRELIRGGVREGFIQPCSEKLCVFIDGPTNHEDHESFNWGQAAVDAIAAWQHDKIETLPFYWTKETDCSAIPDSGADLKEMNGINGGVHDLKATNTWFKKVWHVGLFLLSMGYGRLAYYRT
jgi:hypothetical protein